MWSETWSALFLPRSEKQFHERSPAEQKGKRHRGLFAFQSVDRFSNEMVNATRVAGEKRRLDFLKERQSE